MKHSASDRLARLNELRGLLKSRDHVTGAELAADLGVSLRTLNRDLSLLREEGMPIESDRGRGGGLRLQQAWSLGRVHLGAAEAIDLLVSLAIAERLNAALFRELPAIRRKIVAAFAPAYQGRVRSLRQRILVGSPASKQVMNSYVEPAAGSLTAVAEAFLNQKVVAIRYVDQNGGTTTREVEPQFLYLNMPVWYLLGWDRLREGVRFFRIDRIRSIEVLGESFRLARSEPFLAAGEDSARLL